MSHVESYLKICDDYAILIYPYLRSHPEAPYYSLQDLAHHIGFLVCPDVWKKQRGIKPYIPQFKAFHNTIYKYS